MRRALVLAVIAAAAIAVWMARAGESARAGEGAGAAGEMRAGASAEPAGPVARVANAAGAAPRVIVVHPLPPLPRSLEGTEVDGALAAGPDGRVVADAAARRMFDYFLSASGEEPDETIRARVGAQAVLAGVDRDAALALFDRYVAYRADGAARFADPAAKGADPQAMLDQLRRDHFGVDAEAFFAEPGAADR